MDQIGLSSKSSNASSSKTYTSALEKATKSEVPFRMKVRPLAGTDFVKTYNSHLHHLLSRWSWLGSESSGNLFHPTHQCHGLCSRSTGKTFQQTQAGRKTRRRFVWDPFSHNLHKQVSESHRPGKPPWYKTWYHMSSSESRKFDVSAPSKDMTKPSNN